jgi:hypothetical protein
MAIRMEPDAVFWRHKTLLYLAHLSLFLLFLLIIEGSNKN